MYLPLLIINKVFLKALLLRQVDKFILAQIARLDQFVLGVVHLEAGRIDEVGVFLASVDILHTVPLPSQILLFFKQFRIVHPAHLPETCMLLGLTQEHVGK